MTTEIAIMNKHAIALAADSAVTLSSNSRYGSSKIFNSVNKIFTLSKFHPVGIMIYGSADLMSLPWEILIKEYRNVLGNHSFPTLSEYSIDFIKFLKEHISDIPKEIQDYYFLTNMVPYLKYLFRETLDIIQRDITEKKGEEVNTEKAKEVLLNLLNTTINNITASSLNKLFERDIFEKAFENIYTRFVDQIQQILGDMAQDEDLVKLIKKAIFLVMSKGERNNNLLHNSGIVIGGYGDNDLFPHLKVLNFYGIIANELIYEKKGSCDVSFERNAWLCPFAQNDMISTFTDGVAPDLYEKSKEYLYNEVASLREKILKKVLKEGKDNPKQKEVDNLLADFYSKYNETLDRYIEKSFRDPTIKIVSSLPIPELAQMAETLVSITSFKRKMSESEESVGGPIDVATISKGDGFVWIKRKHYFKPDLNHGFFNRYYLLNGGEIDNGE